MLFFLLPPRFSFRKGQLTFHPIYLSSFSPVSGCDFCSFFSQTTLSPPFFFSDRPNPAHSSLWLKYHPPDTVNLFPAYEWWDGGSPVTSQRDGPWASSQCGPFPAHHPAPFRWAPLGEALCGQPGVRGARSWGWGAQVWSQLPWMRSFDYLALCIGKSKESLVLLHFWWPNIFVKTNRRNVGFGSYKMKNKFGWWKEVDLVEEQQSNKIWINEKFSKVSYNKNILR